MNRLSPEWRAQQLNEQFHRWELRGRGWEVFAHPVALEPPFRVFHGHFLPPAKRSVDDGRQQTFVSGLLARFAKAAPPAEEEASELEVEPAPEYRNAEELVELQLSLPRSRSVPTPQVESFLRHVCRHSETLALEILGTERETVPQLVASPRAATRVRRAVEACFPGTVCAPSDNFDGTCEALSSAWRDSESNFAVAELGLGIEFMLPLGNPRCDLLADIVAAMDGLGKNELALFQVLFEPVLHPWPPSIATSVSDDEGKPFFRNRPELVSAAALKVATPLFAVVIRLAASARDLERVWEIVADLAAPLSAFARSGSNYFIPLHNDNYPPGAHEEDLLTRLSRRSGMLLNTEELISLVTPPVTSNSPKLRRETTRTNPAPEMLTEGGSLCLGVNMHARASHAVFLLPEHRVRHMHVIGASGFGKSTFLLNLIRQDIDHGEGIALFDPHGDLADTIIGLIPPERLDDVIVLDPSDEEYSVGLNVLAAHSDLERSLLASDLTSVFRRLSTSWGDQMETVLRNGILAFLESSRGGTLSDLRHFLIDANFRKEFLRTVTDTEVVYYWTKAFPLLTGGKSIGPLLTRLDEFLSRKPIRYMVSQSENSLDFADILDRGRILIVKLPQGLIGRENAALLGSIIIAKLQMAAMSRQRMPAEQRRDFWCYLDEFQHFITPSMAEILAGARKYRLGLILAHQELRQLDADRDVAGSVLSNCYTRVAFKVADADARALEDGFSHFESRDLMNLGTGEAICRVERSDYDFNLAVPKPELANPDQWETQRSIVITASRTKYARSRTDIEAELRRKFQAAESEAPEPEAKAHAKSPSPPVEIPKVSEPAPNSGVPKPSEIESPKPPLEETKEELSPPRPMPTLGRGGPEHKAIQQAIKETAESLGFRVVIEKAVLGGAGHVDVSIENEGQKIACEISVTSQSEYEVANVRKCFEAGYEIVIAIATQKARLIGLANAVATKLPPDDAKRVQVCLPGRVTSILKKLVHHKTPSHASGARSGSYKIKRKYSKGGADKDSLAAEAEFLRTIATVLRGE